MIQHSFTFDSIHGYDIATCTAVVLCAKLVAIGSLEFGWRQIEVPSHLTCDKKKSLMKWVPGLVSLSLCVPGPGVYWGCNRSYYRSYPHLWPLGYVAPPVYWLARGRGAIENPSGICHNDNLYREEGYDHTNTTPTRAMSEHGYVENSVVCMKNSTVCSLPGSIIAEHEDTLIIRYHKKSHGMCVE